MNKVNYLTFSGVAMSLAGIFVLLSENIGIGLAKNLVLLMFGIGGLFALLFSGANKHYKLARQYYLLLGIGRIICAFLIGATPDSLDGFLKNITYFMGMFGFIELLSGFSALNSNEKINKGVLYFRFFTGFSNLIGAVLILATSITNQINGLFIAGSLVLLGGIVAILFSYKVRKVNLDI